MARGVFKGTDALSAPPFNLLSGATWAVQTVDSIHALPLFHGAVFLLARHSIEFHNRKTKNIGGNFTWM
jgi:hypothetical protein